MSVKAEESAGLITPVVRLGKWLNDRINPIVLKELRQAVRGRFVVGVLLLFLAAATIGLGIGLMSLNATTGSLEHGRGVFMWMYAIMLGTCVLLIPTFTAVRMATERTRENVDLLYATLLTPAAIVRGKTLSAMVLTVVIFSVCLPFMTLTYLLRGIDLATIALLLGFGLISVVTAVVFAILLAALPGTKLLKVLLGLLGLFCLFWMFAGMVATASEIIDMGLGSTVSRWQFWGVAATMVGNAVLAIGLMGACAKACIMPVSANRALSIRVWVAVAWASGLIISILWRDAEGVGVWAFLSMALLSLVLLGAVSEREVIGPRLRRSIPRNRLLRVGAFLLYSGAAGGVVFCLVLMDATVMGALCVQPLTRGFMGHSEFWEMIEGLAGFGLYMVCYALTALLVRRAVPWRRLAPSRTWAVALVIFGVMMIIPVVAMLFVMQRPPYRMEEHWGWYLFTPIMLFDDETRGTGLVFSMLWAAVMLLLSLPWLARQIRQFRPLERGVPEKTATELPPVDLRTS